MEKSPVDILKDIAKKADWEFNIKEKKNSIRHGRTIREVLIKNLDKKDSYFVSAQTNNFDKFSIYSGLFFPVTGHDNYKLLIRKRNVLDDLSFRKNKLRFKIGNSSFDSKVNIETNNDIETHKLLSNAKIQLEILEYLNSTDCRYIGFNEINPNFNKDLKGKKFLSVFMALGWMLDKRKIDASYKLGVLLKSKFN